MRAFIYCRVSTVEQVDNLSLETQETACRAYCAREGFEIARIFVDKGESAKTTNRPAFLDLLARCRAQKGHIHAVVVHSLTRFSRNSEDHHVIAGLLRGHGIVLRSATEPIGESPSGRLMEGILAAMAQFDNDVRSERVVAGMKTAVTSHGRWVWSAPIGYLNANARHGTSLVPDPERAPMVRAAFELCDQGIVGLELLRRVTALGLRTKRGHRMPLNRLYDLLRHPAYAGYIRSQAFAADRRGDFVPLVPLDLFERVQARLMTPQRAPRRGKLHRDHPDFPLRRFVHCSTCRAPLTGSWSLGRNGQRYGFYHCLKGCQRVRREPLHDAFLALLNDLAPRPDYLRAFHAVVLDIWRDEQQQTKLTARALTRRVETLQGKLARLEEAFVFERVIDRTSYERQRDDTREQIAGARLELNEATRAEIDVEALLAFSEHVLTHAAALWTAAATVDERIAVQSTLFPDGLVWDAGAPAAECFQVTGTPPRLGNFVRPASCLRFFQLEGLVDESVRMVDHPAASWKQIIAYLQHMQRLATAA